MKKTLTKLKMPNKNKTPKKGNEPQPNLILHHIDPESIVDDDQVDVVRQTVSVQSKVGVRSEDDLEPEPSTSKAGSVKRQASSEADDQSRKRNTRQGRAAPKAVKPKNLKNVDPIDPDDTDLQPDSYDPEPAGSDMQGRPKFSNVEDVINEVNRLLQLSRIPGIFSWANEEITFDQYQMLDRFDNLSVGDSVSEVADVVAQMPNNVRIPDSAVLVAPSNLNSGTGDYLITIPALTAGKADAKVRLSITETDVNFLEAGSDAARIKWGLIKLKILNRYRNMYNMDRATIRKNP